MSAQTVGWLVQLNEVRRLHTELRRVAPYRDDGLLPNPSATLGQIAQAETRLGFGLPPSYRAFLLRHDGWRRFLDGADLLGTAALGDPRHLRAAEVLFGKTIRGSSHAPHRLVPFGLDAQMCSMFAFDVNCASPEKPVFAWVGEIGVQVANFTEFLKLAADLAALQLNSSRLTDAVNPTPNIAASAA
jgi:SMI1 / KNR4 family (SUKH-1)